MAAIFTQGFQVAEDNFKNTEYKCLTLENYGIMIKKAIACGYVKEPNLASLAKWRENPAALG